MTRATDSDGNRCETGITGLDDVLSGGLIPHRLYLVDGDPGAGKTTLALQFLMAGVKRGEKCLYITLSETKEELLAGSDLAWLVTRRHRYRRANRGGAGS